MLSTRAARHALHWPVIVPALLLLALGLWHLSSLVVVLGGVDLGPGPGPG